MATEETKASLAERLRAITTSLSMEPGGDATTAKFIFDLRAAAGAVEDLEGLVGLVLDGLPEAQEEDRRAEPMGTEQQDAVRWQIEELARLVRDRLSKANPE